MKAERIVHIVFTVVTLLFLLTGYGITEFRTIEWITGGFLTKSLSYQIHSFMAAPFTALLILHVTLVLYRKIR